MRSFSFDLSLVSDGGGDVFCFDGELERFETFDVVAVSGSKSSSDVDDFVFRFRPFFVTTFSPSTAHSADTSLEVTLTSRFGRTPHFV